MAVTYDTLFKKKVTWFFLLVYSVFSIHVIKIKYFPSDWTPFDKAKNTNNQQANKLSASFQLM